MEKGLPMGTLGGIVSESQDNFGEEKNRFNLTTVTLLSLLQYLKAPSTIDYFSLVVEGGEWDVSRKFDFSLYKFRVISIERPVTQLQILFHKKWL